MRHARATSEISPPDQVRSRDDILSGALECMASEFNQDMASEFTEETTA